MTTTQWQYLEKRPHTWRQQLYIKGNWNLPLAVIEEVITYCQTHQELLKSEAKEGRRRLEEKGVSLEPKITH